MKLSSQIKNKSTQSQVALHLMINQFSNRTLPVEKERNNRIVNDVPSSFQVKTDAHKLATVIHTLLNTVMNHSETGSISISARKYHQVTLLHIKEKSRINTPDFAQQLIEVQTLAEDIGGSVSVTSYRNDVTTIALSVIDQAA